MGQALQKIETGDRFEVYTDGKQKVIKLKNVRISFPACGTQKAQQDDDGNDTEDKAWQVTPMLKKGMHDAARARCRKLIDEILLEHGTAPQGGGAKKPLKMEPQYICLKDGDEKDRAEYEGHWIISASEKTRHPTARNVQGDLIMNDSEIDKVFYGGCYANVMIRFWFFNGKAKGKTKEFPKRVCAGFVGIQFLRDGEPFGQGRIDDTDAWGAEDVASSDEDDGLGGGSSGDDEI